MNRIFFIVNLIIIGIFIIPTELRSNIAVKIRPEDYRASKLVINPLQNIKVLREDLTIDFTNNNEIKNRALITAIYEIECTEFIDSLSLIFVAGSVYNGIYSIKFNEYAIKSDTSVYIKNIPKSWLSPDSVQWYDYKIPYHSDKKIQNSYFSQNTDLIPFTIKNVKQGKHVLKITYTAYTSLWFTNKDLSPYESLVYILKPDSVGWKSFNNLYLTIIIPKEFDYYCNIQLENLKTNNGIIHLNAYYKDLPANYLSFTLHKNEKKAKTISAIFEIASWLIVLGICFMWIVVKARRRYKKGIQISTRKILYINYTVSIIIILIEFVILLLINNTIIKCLLPVIIIIPFWLVIKYFPSKHKNRLILRYLNCILYGFSILLVSYYIITILNVDRFIIILFLLLLTTLSLLTIRLSNNRKRQKKLIISFNNTLIAVTLALLTTICFYIIHFYKLNLLRYVLEGHINPIQQDIYIILVAPLIFTLTIPIALVINYITDRVIKKSF